MMRAGAFVVCALSLAASPQQPPRFRASAEAVAVDVLVMNGNRPVAGLTAADFEVRDSGVPQAVSAVSMADVPLSVMLALDTSTSVRGPALERLKQATLAALDQLAAGDRAALLAFNHAVVLHADWSAPTAGFRSAVGAMQAGGFTSLHDGLFTALQMRDSGGGRRALTIVFTDGGETTSWLPMRAVVEKARRTDAVIYAVVASSVPDAKDYSSGVQLWSRGYVDPLGSDVLGEITAISGGERLVTRSGDDLRATFRKVVRDFRSRYLLTYTPAGVDTPGWHPIEVRLERGRGKITARRGYLR